MNLRCEVTVSVICGDTHDLAAEFAEHRTLFGFSVDIRPHLVGRAVFKHDFALSDFVFNVKILNLDMFRAFRAARLTIRFQ